ncbi:MAG: hypothetical protein JW750_11430, partial [Anaerolineaceae bacterium]|nr:hypothetical protein [Anaerolineaceae bacterium]
MSTCLQFLSTRRRIFSFSLILVMLLVNFLPMGAVSAETPVFINEIHYDNTSTDAGEAIEIAGPAGTDLTGWQIVLYNGSGGAAYNTRTLAGAIPDMGGGYGFAMYDYPTNGIQNGSPDGIALIDNLGNVIQFLSYEGTFTAADGPAAGEMSVDIGVAEGSDTPANFSLQLTGSGTNYEDFSWAEPSAFTWLDFNNGQTIGGGSGGDPEDPEDPGDPEDPASVPMINEIRIDQGGTDNDEYFELAGVPGLSLDGYTYLVIGDGTGGSGVIEAVVDLSGQTIPSSGYFVAAEGSFTLGTADLIANLNFENGDNVTHLLVKDFTGSNGADLDTDDDGMLDSTLWTELVDSVALVQSFTSGELIYSTNTVGPDGAYVPGHAYRCWQGWEIGGFTLGTNDTPGAENLCPVSVALSEIRIDQGGTDNDEYFELAGAPGTALDGFTYVVIGDGTGASGVIESVTDLTGQVIPSSGFFVAAESTFTIGTADFIADLNFENSDNVTHLLVKDFTGSYGDDLDTDDDGVLDSMPWASVVDSVALVETVGSGDLIYSDNTVGPDGTFVPGHVYTCLDEWLIGAFEIVGGFDTPGAENLCGSQCGRPATLISAVQGSGGSTPYFGEYVTVEGVVTADFQAYGQLGGFFLQEEVSDQDSDPLTSEGIYVYNYSNAVSVGDVVRVTAEATEYYGLTELRYPTQFEVCASGAELPPATTVTLPVSSLDMWEPYEGMLLTIQQTLYVSDNYSLGRYGELALSVNDRLWNPTNVAEPGADAWAVRDLNDRSRIMVDDASNWENPDPLPPYFMSDLTLRAGDTTPSLTGVLYYSYGDYMIEPTVALDFTRANPRTVAPSFSNSTIKVASMNVLNYFTTLVVNEP